MNERSRGELQLFMSRPEGCEQNGRLRNSEFAQLRKYICCTMKVQHCKSHEALNKNAGTGSSGCISARSCLSAVAANTSNASASAEHLIPRLRPGPLDHVQRSHVELLFSTSSPEQTKRPWLLHTTKGPPPARLALWQFHLPRGVAVLGDRQLVQGALSVNQNWQQVETAASWKSCSVTGLRRPFRGVRGSWSFRLYGGLPRGVAVLCDRRPMLSCICTPARRIPRRPSNLTDVCRCASFEKKTSSSPHLVHHHQH